MARLGLAKRDILIWNGTSKQAKEDLIAVEEPMEIRLHFGDDTSRKEICLAVTMRTPGHDIELALGFLFSEGIIESMDDVISAHHCENVEKEDERENVLRVRLQPNVEVDEEKLKRNFYISSSCGVCGKTSIESVMQHCQVNTDTTFRISQKMLFDLPQRLSSAQLIFGHTGGIHASAAFNQAGNLLVLREDVGRHNALDKLLGMGLTSGKINFGNSVLLLSGRLSFELVQKAALAGFPVVVGVGAPSSLAIQLAAQSGITLVGFAKSDRFNCYTYDERIIDET